MHDMVLHSLSLGLNKNERLNKGHWAERLNCAKPPNCLHLLNFTIQRPEGTLYPSDILHWSFRQIWMNALVCLKWYRKVSPISSPMDWNNASKAHQHCISPLYLDRLSDKDHSEGKDSWHVLATDPPGQHRYGQAWLNLTGWWQHLVTIHSGSFKKCLYYCVRWLYNIEENKYIFSATL